MATTPLNDNRTGIGVRKFNSFSSTQVSQAISRHQYHEGMKNNEKVRRFSEAVYSMVSKWSPEDKVALIREYGDGAKLGKRPSEEDLNVILTEAIIVNLNQNDLKKLMSDVVISQNSFVQDVRKIQRKTKANSAFNVKNFERYYEFMRSATDQKEYKNLRKKLMKGFKIPKHIEKRYPALRKELETVLKECFNTAELESLAASMGIEVYEKMKVKDLHNDIINKTMLYVDLVVGKSKYSMLSGAIMDPEPYNSILLFTSFAYVTGTVGLDYKVVQKLRNNAKLAKQKMELSAKYQSKKAHVSSKAFEEITGFRKKGLFATLQAEKELAKNDKGPLANATRDELLAYAHQFGIEVKPKETEAGLKRKIYEHLAAVNKDAERNKVKLGKEFAKRPFSKKTDLLNIKDSAYDALLGVKSTGNSDSGGAVPTISFDPDGKVKSLNILKAVPVYIVGEGAPGDSYLKDKIRDNKITDLNGNRYDTANMTGGPIVQGDDNYNYLKTIENEIKEGNSMNVYSRLLKDLKTSEVSRKVIDDIQSKTSFDNPKSVKQAIDEMMYLLAVDKANAAGKRKSKNKKEAKKNEEEKKSAEALAVHLRDTKFKENTNSANKDNFFGRTTDTLNQILAKPTDIKLDDVVTPLYGISDILENKFMPLIEGINTNQEMLPNLFKLFEISDTDTVGNCIRDIHSELISPFSELREWFSHLNTIKNLLADPNDPNKGVLGENLPHLSFIRGFLTDPNDPDKGILGSIHEILSNNLSHVEEIKKHVGVIPRSLKTILQSLGVEDPLIAQYKLKFGEDTIDDNGLVNITDRKNADYIDQQVGRTAKDSTRFPNQQPNQEKKYKPTNATLKYAIDNNMPFDPNSTVVSDITTEDSKKNSKKKNAVRVLSVFTETEKLSKFSVRTDIHSNGLDDMSLQPVIPVFVTNDTLITDGTSYDSEVKSAINSLSSTITTSFTSFVGNVGPFPATLTTPTTGAATAIQKAKEIAEQAATQSFNMAEYVKNISSNIGTSSRVFTGGKITRFATGGTAAITGDSSKANMFANGAKPELVQSTGDMTVQPLNKAGTENRQKVSRLSTTERRNALATAISSHVVKFNYQLPGTTELSNTGEAIKVYNVKPGIADPVETRNGTFSVMDLLSGIYGLLVEMNATESSQVGLLGEIAKNTIPTSSGGSSGSSPFTGGFPDSLDGILSGI